jgi:hypothetical protein
MYCNAFHQQPATPSGPSSGLERVTALFKDSYGMISTVVASAPGRVNLIGEHLDYNGGAVLPFGDRSADMGRRERRPRLFAIGQLGGRFIIPFTERRALPRATGATTSSA